MIVQLIHSEEDDDVHWVACDTLEQGSRLGQREFGAAPGPHQIFSDCEDDDIIAGGGVDADYRERRHD